MIFFVVTKTYANDKCLATNFVTLPDRVVESVFAGADCIYCHIFKCVWLAIAQPPFSGSLPLVYVGRTFQG